jgi:hypothetical protein
MYHQITTSRGQEIHDPLVALLEAGVLMVCICPQTFVAVPWPCL